MKKFTRFLIASLSIFFSFSLSLATTFYVDPNTGDIAGSGALGDPWSTLEEVFDNNYIETQSYTPLPYTANSSLQIKNAGAPVEAGDTLMLMNGYHGRVDYRGFYNQDYIVIMAYPGHVPSLGSFHLTSTEKVVLDGILISPETSGVLFYTTLFNIESHGYHGPSRDIKVRNCRLQGIANSTAWGLEEWNDVGSCMHIEGDEMEVVSNECLNIDHGITMVGSHSLISDNSVINFAGDGLRGLGSYLTFEYNTVKNCYDVNDNHDDGFQSFTSVGNPFVGNILRGNTIINWEDDNQPFKGSLQGIGCFDGPYVDWIVENNVIVVNHYHGISLYGAQNCKIVNNTVIDRDLANSPNGTWIKINAHKNGDPSSNCLIQNNFSFGYSYGPETDFITNLLITDYSHFEDAQLSDFHLKSGSNAINAGTNTDAPFKDRDKKRRPVGTHVDIGAYEFGSHPPCDVENLTILQDLSGSSSTSIYNSLSNGSSITLLPGSSQVFNVGGSVLFTPTFEVAPTATLEILMKPCSLVP